MPIDRHANAGGAWNVSRGACDEQDTVRGDTQLLDGLPIRFWTRFIETGALGRCDRGKSTPRYAHGNFRQTVR